MAPFNVGDVVWVRTGTGDHEEPAIVVEKGCTTEDGDVGVKCKLQVSLFETVFALDAIRAMPTGRPKRRRTSPTQPAHPRKVVTPSPTTIHVAKKRKKVESDGMVSANNKQPRRVSPTSPHFEKTTMQQAEKVVNATVKKGVISKKAKLDFHSETNSIEDDKPVSSVQTLALKPTRGVIKTGAVSTRKVPAKAAAQSSSDDSESESSEDAALVTLKKSTAKSAKAAVPKKPASMHTVNNAGPKEIQPAALLSVDEQSDSDTDHPFDIEYSPSGRATCRRCDEVIAKGAVRVSHTPLFRGKPGYVVYRHLKCSVFSEEVQSAQDVGGWRKLSKDDYDALVRRVEESKEDVKKENEELDPDELVPVSFQGEMRPPPKGLAANLLPFQIEGVSWMHHQEISGESGVHGGMLCDEMGMGKTIQTIAAILDNRPKLQHSMPGAKHPAEEKEARQAEEERWAKHQLEWQHEMEMNNVSRSILPKSASKKAGGGFRAGTLVICPVIALSQWKTEIEKFTEGGALTVGIYHGPDRITAMPREMMCKYDVVLTTYQVLEADFRKMTSPNKIKCPNCGGKFKIDKLRVHLKYFCGEGAERTEAQARQRRNGESTQGRGRVEAAKSKGMAKSKSNTKTKTFTSKRIKRAGDCESESELSDLLDTRAASKGRLSRKASMVAKKRMSGSMKKWSAEKDEDSEDYDYSGESTNDDSSENDSHYTKKIVSRQRVKRVTKAELNDENSDDSDAVARAYRKQEEALAQLSKKSAKGKTKTVAKPKPPRKNDSKDSLPKGKHSLSKGKKSTKRESSDDDDSDDNVNPSDPMDGIDMDALMKEAMDGSRLSLLHSLCWWRIVLDEAHFIKSRSSQTANAAFALISINRWCLSGTPLQNRVSEFYSLIRFLRIDPMAHYFCRAKECSCKSLHYRMMNGRCQDCGHGSVQHFSHFNKHVLNPIQRAGYSGDGRRAMFTLKKDILDKCLLRRTKENRAADMKLPPRLVSIRTVRLHPIEEDFYNALYTQTQSSFNDYVAEGTLLNNYAHIFDLLMRMRQAVDHPYLVVYSKKDSKARASNGIAIANGTADCGICHESPTDLVISSCCEAAFCRSCVEDYMAVDREGSIPCPGCSAPFSIDLNQTTIELTGEQQPKESSSDPMPLLKDLTNVPSGSILRRINLAEYATSTKIEALVEELMNMRETSPGSKAIVFSQFVNMLDLIRWRLHSDPCLKDMGLGARALHGGMDVKARDVSLKDFREDPNVRVLLMSLKAGGVALNLTVANNIYLMDPWWNPAAEMQAIDRTHRLGQYRPIRAVRFIAEDTVEERILQLQEKKRLVFDGTIGRDAGSLKMLTVDDMKALFA